MDSRDAPRVLIATISLTGIGGTDLYTRDLARGLLRHGWTPTIYSTIQGPLADDLRRATIPVVNRLESIAATPHIIHGQHILETLAALARFPNVPAIYVCHDSVIWHSVPPSSPRITQYVAVDRNCRDRMMLEYAIPEDSIRIVPNAVDLQRFQARGHLPPRPLRALVFSNSARENTWMGPIRRACEQRGMAVDVMGLGSGRYSDRPEAAIGAYDVVFAKARCALEALACGTAVIVCDFPGLGGMVTTRNLHDMRQLNFGLRTLSRPITLETIAAELDRYDAADARAVSDHVRAVASTDLLAAEFVTIYEQVLEGYKPVEPYDDMRGVSESLQRVLSVVHRGSGRSRLARTWRFIANSKMLSFPVRQLYALRRWLRR